MTVCPHHSTWWKSGYRGGVSPGQNSHPSTCGHYRNTLGRSALVIETERSQCTGDRGVSVDIHEFRPISQASQLVEVQKRGSGERGFPTKDPIEFDGMSNGLMNLQCQLAPLQDEVGHRRRTLIGPQQRRCFICHSRGVAWKVPPLDDLVSAGFVLAEGLWIRPNLRLTITHSQCIHSASRLNDVLMNAVALR